MTFEQLAVIVAGIVASLGIFGYILVMNSKHISEGHKVALGAIYRAVAPALESLTVMADIELADDRYDIVLEPIHTVVSAAQELLSNVELDPTLQQAAQDFLTIVEGFTDGEVERLE